MMISGRAMGILGLGLIGLSGATACTEASALPAQATVAVSLANDPATPGGCAFNTAREYAPSDDTEVSRLSRTTTSATAAELPRVKDGKDKASVDCSVVDLGNGSYDVSGALTESLSFNYTGAMPGAGSVQLYSPNNFASFTATDCQATVEETYEGGGGIRGSVECNGAEVKSQPGKACRISATFIFERCDK